MNARFVVLFALALVFTSFQTQAQNQTHRSTFSLNVGGSLLGVMFEDVYEVKDNYQGLDRIIFDGKSQPAIQFNADYGLTKWFSLGVASSYQKMEMETRATHYNNEEPDLITEVANIVLHRTNIAVRPLFHYANNNKLDLYSGLRIGYSFHLGGIESDNDHYEIEQFMRNELGKFDSFSLQVIPFGMRFYITENIGLNGEIAIGSPHFMSGGLSYRF